MSIGLRSDGSFRMTNDSLDYLWNPDAPADWFVKFPLKVITFGKQSHGVFSPDKQRNAVADFLFFVL